MSDSEIKVVGLAGKSKNKKTNWKIVSAIIGIVVLAIGVIAGIILVRQNQDIRESAKECSLGGHACPDPNNPNLLRDCSTGEIFPNDSVCDRAGRVEVCGATPASAKQFCCPAPGAAWTTNLTLCDCNASAPKNLRSDNILSSSAVLKWAVGTGGKYRIWVSKNSNPTGNCGSNPSTCIVNDVSLPISTTEYEVTGLAPNTKYYWRIMSWTREGCDSGSDVVNFTTLTSGGGGTPTATPKATATPTATSTSTSKATATSTSTSSATKTATATATSTTSGATASPVPVPETGASWVTILGAGSGLIMILLALGLAL